MSRKLIVEVVGDSRSFERSLTRATRQTKTFTREFSAAERGVLSGSGVFKSLGRSLAFASGGFLAFGGAAAFIRKTIDAAKEAEVANRQLEQQFKNNGRELAPYRAQIDRTTASLSAMSGIEDDQIKAGLTTILRAQPNVTKALRDTATAADLARAKNISYAQAALIVAKVEGGNTTILRRALGIKVKSGKVEEALAILRQKVAGQAAAGTTEEERFGAVLHQTEEIIGLGLLPTLNKYLLSGTEWLQQLNESGKLQEDVASAAGQLSHAIGEVADVVKGVDKITGSFKNTLELLLGIKLTKWALGVVTDFGLIGGSATVAEGEVLGLTGALAGLNALAVAPIVIPIEFVIGKHERDLLQKYGGRFGAFGKALLDVATAGGAITGGNLITDVGRPLVKHLGGMGGGGVPIGGRNVTPIPNEEAASKAAAARARIAAERVTDAIAKAVDDVAKKPRTLTAKQRNTFFDNAIARILLRGGLGSIQDQIAALEKADSLIRRRLKITKDVTRRLNLEDELLQNQAQIASLRSQQAADAASAAADALQKRQSAFDEFIAGLQLKVTEAEATATLDDDIRALKALQAGIQKEIVEFGRTADLQGQLFDVQQQLAAKTAARATGRQFVALGLTATGDTPIPGVRALRRELGVVDAAIAGTFLDTRKTRSLLGNIRKVLSGGLGAVGQDVRSKIQQILGDLNRQLDQNTAKNLTKWRHISTQAFLAGIPNLTPEQKRQLQARLATLGPGGTVPPGASAAFSATYVYTDVYLDGDRVARTTTKHQRRTNDRRTTSRRGPYAGRH